MNSGEKRAALQALNRGESVTLIDGRIAIYIRLLRTNFIGRMNNSEYKIPIDLFAKVGTDNAEAIKRKYESETIDRLTDNYRKQQTLKTLNPGDIISVNGENNVEFIKVNTKTFYGKADAATRYQYPISFFKEVVERKEDPCANLKQLIELVKGFKIKTADGRFEIGSLTDDNEGVIVYNGGPHIISLEEFKRVLINNKLI